MNILLLTVALSLILALTDYYVYHNWSRFARGRRFLNWTRVPYLLLLAVMPLVLPLFVHFTNWWEVEPKIFRAGFIAFWIFWYGPKILIVPVLLIKDTIRLIRWLTLYGGFRRKTTVEDPAHIRSAGVNHLTRSEFLQKMGWAAAGVPFAIVGHGILRTLYHFQIRHVHLPIRDLPRELQGLRIGQLSDIHAGSFFSARPMREVAELIARENPDLLAFTGDFVNNNVAELDLIWRELQSLTAPLGAFACRGNHEHYANAAAVTTRLEAAGIRVLVNEHATVSVDGAFLHLIGTDNTGFGQNYANLPAAVTGLTSQPNGEEVRVLLAHDPSYWDRDPRTLYPEIDLTLAGHTHGGQVGIELGPLRWGLSRIVYERWAGLYRERATTRRGEQYLYVNRGIGTVGPPMRLGVRPEITVITLIRA